MLILANVVGWIQAHRGTAAAIALTLFFVGVILYAKACYVEHQIDKQADVINNTKIDEANKDAVSKTATSEGDRKTKDAQNASNASKKAIENVNKARANVKNVPINESDRWRCEAYPEDCK